MCHLGTDRIDDDDDFVAQSLHEVKSSFRNDFGKAAKTLYVFWRRNSETKLRDKLHKTLPSATAPLFHNNYFFIH